MPHFSTQPPVILCSDKREERAQILAQYAPTSHRVFDCHLTELEALARQHSNAQILLCWSASCAEVQMVVEFCRAHDRNLVVMLKQFNSQHISNLTQELDYVVMPYSPQCDWISWFDYAAMVRARYQHIQAQIASLQQKLEERKIIEKAKGLVMRHHRLDEQSAYKALRDSAMQNSQPIYQVAKNVLVSMQAQSAAK
ncbi:response regulator NasT [Vibrio xiamenensis]|uniref:Response regulator NasT n=2 Tax=Vibrio xiamenensis TaxID=861298 RepID=A0A1G7YY74_9VIBR|nr:response regulator NasT [Vibrio xiamenensis]